MPALKPATIGQKFLTDCGQNRPLTTIYIYYAEFEEDRPPVESKYKEVLREKCSADFGYLRDEELDKEVKDVNPPRV